jgi:hypothetical protein
MRPWIVLLIAGIVQEPLSDKEFRELHAKLVPSAEDKWQTIPWKTGLLEARAVAAKEGKPVFLWSMNGHPLGCT